MTSNIKVTMFALVLSVCCLYHVTGLPALTDRLLYSCTFETGLCGATIEPYPNGFTWTRFQGSTPSENTGPDFDHTTLTDQGWYMYTEATEFLPGDIAKISLPALPATPPPSGAICLTFWFNMYGQHCGTLNVTQGDTDVLWSLSYNQSYGWFQNNVTVRSPAAGVLRFVGVRGGRDIGQPFGDIAIDDVFIYDGSCGADETTTVPTTTTTTVTTTVPTTTVVTTSTAMPTTETTSVPTTTVVTSSTAMPTTETTSVSTTPEATSTPTTTVPAQTTALTAVVSTSDVPTTSTETPATTPETTQQVQTTGLITAQSDTTAVQSTSAQLTSGVSSTDQTSQRFGNIEVNTSIRPTAGSAIVTSQTKVNAMTSGFTETSRGITGNQQTSTPSKEAQAGNVQQQNIWGLSHANLILILALLSAAILCLIIAIIVLACCLCFTRRKYNVARSNNIYASDNSIDRISTVESHRGKENASFDRISVEY